MISDREHMLQLAASLDATEFFDYSEKEWQAIEAIVEQDLKPAMRGSRHAARVRYPIMGRSISGPRSGRSTPTKQFNYLELRTAANCFLDEKFEPPDERRRALTHLMKQTEEFRFSVAALEDSWDLLTDVFFTQLDKVYSCARYQLAMLNIEGSPKWRFYNAVLNCWADAGGQIKASRGSPGSNRAGQPIGPLIEYFEAAVRPVMEDKAPGREAIYKIISERKATDAEIDAEIEKLMKSDDHSPIAQAIRDGRKRG